MSLEEERRCKEELMVSVYFSLFIHFVQSDGAEPYMFTPEHGLDTNVKTRPEPKNEFFSRLLRPYVAYYKLDSDF